MFFKKSSTKPFIYEALEKEENPNKKKLLEDYKNKLVLFGEFIIYTGLVPTDKKSFDVYKSFLWSIIREYKNSVNNNLSGEYINKVINMYSDWQLKISKIETPIFLEDLKKLVIEYLEYEKKIFNEKSVISNRREVIFLEETRDAVIYGLDAELKKVCVYMNNEAKKINVSPLFDLGSWWTRTQDEIISYYFSRQ